MQIKWIVFGLATVLGGLAVGNGEARAQGPVVPPTAALAPAAAPLVAAPPAAATAPSAPMASVAGQGGAASPAGIPLGARPPRVGLVLSRTQALIWDNERGEYRLIRTGDTVGGGLLAGVKGQHLIIRLGAQSFRTRLTWPPRALAAVRPVDAVRAMAPIAAPIAVPAPAGVAPAAAPIAPAPGAPLVAPAVPFIAPAAPVAPAAPRIGLPPAPPVKMPVLNVPAGPGAAVPPPAEPPILLTNVPPPAEPPVATVPPPAEPPAVEAPRKGRGHTIARAALDHELRDFSRLSSQLGITPGARGGFLITAIKPGTFFAKLGLRVGDVVKSLDTIRLDSLDDAAKAYARLGELQSFVLTVERGGKPLALRYTLKG